MELVKIFLLKINENTLINEVLYKSNDFFRTFEIPPLILNPFCNGLNLLILTHSDCFGSFPGENCPVLGVGSIIIDLFYFSQFNDFRGTSCC